MTLVQDFLEVPAAQCPDKVALVCSGERVTYGELNDRSNRLAAALLEAGLRKGDRVVLQLPNSVALVVGIFAVLKAGGVFVVVNATTKQDKLAYILNNCRASGVVLESRSPFLKSMPGAALPHLRSVVLCGKGAPRLEAPGFRVLSYETIQAADGSEAPGRVQEATDLACLIYTSGTTGQPKGVMSDHGNVVFASGSVMSYLDLSESDVVINVLPLAFDYGLYQVFMAFRCGATLVLETSFAFPAAILKRIGEEQVTVLPAVPTLFAMLLQMDLSSFDLSRLRSVTNTAAALPVAHIRQFESRFPKVTLYSMYGLTETKRTLYLPPAELARRPESVGIPIPGTEAWIEDDAGQRVGPGEVGELVARGRHVMQGYWEAPDATAERFREADRPEDRRCHTGDLFRADKEGYFYFVGRKDDIIKSRGEKVAPREVENVLYQMDGVAEAAVVGVADDLLGQAIKALVVPRDATVTVKEVMAHCRRHLEDYMMPKVVELRQSLPKTASGKIQRSALS